MYCILSHSFAVFITRCDPKSTMCEDIWERLSSEENFLDSSGIFLIYYYYIFLSVKAYIHLHTHPTSTPATLVPSSFNHASASPTMDRVPAVPDLHADIWGDCSSAHQLGLWTYCLQDVPEQVAPQGLPLRPDSHQHRHRAATCQHSPVAAGGRTGEWCELACWSVFEEMPGDPIYAQPWWCQLVEIHTSFMDVFCIWV